TRQYGLLLPVVALAYLWWSRRWTWRAVVPCAAVPAAVAVGYLLWERSQPVQLISFHIQTVGDAISISPLGFALFRSQRVAWSLSVLGLYLLPVLRLPRRPLFAVPVLSF